MRIPAVSSRSLTAIGRPCSGPGGAASAAASASSIGSWEGMVERGVDVVVGEANIRFRAAARFDDLITISASIVHLGTTSLKLELLIHRGDELLIEGWLRQVFVDVKSFGKTPIPEWVREALAPYVASADGAGA